MLQKLESGLLYVMRVLMAALVLFTMFSLAVWGFASLGNSTSATSNSNVDWSSFKIDDADLKRTTYGDFGITDVQTAENDDKLAKDAAVVTAFAEVDSLLRGAINQHPAKRKQIDEENGDGGLAAPQSLEEWIKTSRAKNSTAALAADAASAAAAAVDGDDSGTTQTNITESLLNQVHSVIESNNYDAGRAFVLGAPAAFKTLLADPQVQRGMEQQATSYLVSNFFVNYSMAFSNRLTTVNGVGDADSAKPSWLTKLLEPANLMVFTVLIWSLVFLILVVVFLRVERHLRALATEGRLLVQQKDPKDLS